jgi:trans-aconitate 2-methyltransferase
LSKVAQDWNPETYARFRGLRLRPALDLLAQVPEVPAGDVIDLGCGDGAVAADLAMRFGARWLVGVDTSAAMLQKARETGLYRSLTQADIALWAVHQPAALIFSNAVLHWLPAHDVLMPRLAAMLMPGGVLAVQMPRQFAAASHRLIREVAVELFPDRFGRVVMPLVAEPATYHAMLAHLGEVSVWETEYLQVLGAEAEGHPVRAFTESTAMRPFVEKLTAREAAAFIAAYDVALQTAYPVLPDGSALFPFRRLFIILRA